MSGDVAGRGGSGAVGGSEGGGLLDVGETAAGDGGICEGGTGNASRRNGTGVCLLMTRCSVVVAITVVVAVTVVLVIVVLQYS